MPPPVASGTGQPDLSGLMAEMQARPFARSDIFRHPPVKGSSPSPELAAIRKNESSCVVVLGDGRWLATWSQGSFEGAVDEQIVGSYSADLGQTWSPPHRITASTAVSRRSYGCPFVAPATGRIYLFLHEGRRHGGAAHPNHPEVDAGTIGFLWSDDSGATWSDFRAIALPDRDISLFPDRIHAHLNHPPQILPGGLVVLPFTHSMRNGATRRYWQLCTAEASLLACENLLTEPDPARLRFSLLPPGPRGVRASIARHADNPAVKRLAAAFGGHPEELASNA